MGIEFDVDTLSPTYKLLMSIPGYSDAPDVSGRLGLSLNIINKAKATINTDEEEINEVIEPLEYSYKHVETQRLGLDRLVREAEQVHDDLSKQYRRFQNYEKSLIEDTKEKTNQKIRVATREADDIVRDLRQLRE